MLNDTITVREFYVAFADDVIFSDHRSWLAAVNGQLVEVFTLTKDVFRYSQEEMDADPRLGELEEDYELSYRFSVPVGELGIKELPSGYEEQSRVYAESLDRYLSTFSDLEFLSDGTRN